MAKFSSQHYNAIAKDIREHLDPIMDFNKDLYGSRAERWAATDAVVTLAVKFARRFQEDNERFDPLKFLDACSPNTDLYPLSELWED